MSLNFPGGYLKVSNLSWSTYYGKEVKIVENETERLTLLYPNAKITLHKLKLVEPSAFSIDIEFKDEADESEFILRESI